MGKKYIYIDIVIFAHTLHTCIAYKTSIHFINMYTYRLAKTEGKVTSIISKHLHLLALFELMH